MSGEMRQCLEDPVAAKMWHHSFDPNRHVPPVAEASLKAPPQTIRSQTVEEFMQKQNVGKSLIMQALAQNKKAEPAQKPSENLVALSKSTGISLETLQTIK